jgi:molecular chaperone DnaJ
LFCEDILFKINTGAVVRKIVNGNMMICYYKILGVSVRASQEEIKSAFRMLAMRWHPDRNPGNSGAAEHFRSALEAYETLIDPQKRRQYDKLRGKKKSNGGSRRYGYKVKREPDDFSRQVIKDIFGIHLKHFRQESGYDLRFDLQVPRSALAMGTHEQIDYKRWVFCRQCMGNGHRLPVRSCEGCRGNGEMEEACCLRIWVPAGSEQGTRLRFSGAGDRLTPNSPAGDLVVLLHVVEGQ